MSGNQETAGIFATGLTGPTIVSGLAHAVLVESAANELGYDDARTLKVRASVAPHLADGAADEFVAALRKSDIDGMRGIAENVAERSGTSPTEAFAATLAITTSPDCVIDDFVDAVRGLDTPEDLVKADDKPGIAADTLDFLSRRGGHDALIRLVGATMLAWGFIEEVRPVAGNDGSGDRYRQFCKSLEQAASDPEGYQESAGLISHGAFGRASAGGGTALPVADAVAISLMPYPVCEKIAEAAFG